MPDLRAPKNFKRILLGLAVVAFGAFVTGFFFFVGEVARKEASPMPPADGIVALTGGTSRINDAVKLLSEGYGRRLLVTGLHPATSRYELAHMMGEDAYLVECCVDLDYEAVNTIGNAVETRKWAQMNGFFTLMIVTSNYHMPRTLVELRREFPEGKFIPKPVTSTHVQMEDWWMHPATLRLLTGEYVKYLGALARSALKFAG